MTRGSTRYIAGRRFNKREGSSLMVAAFGLNSHQSPTNVIIRRNSASSADPLHKPDPAPPHRLLLMTSTSPWFNSLTVCLLPDRSVRQRQSLLLLAWRNHCRRSNAGIRPLDKNHVLPVRRRSEGAAATIHAAYDAAKEASCANMRSREGLAVRTKTSPRRNASP